MFNKFDETFKAYSPEKIFPSIKCPVHIIRGNVVHGGLVTDKDIADAHCLLANMTDVQLPNVGHALMESPRELLKAIQAYVGRD